MSKESKNLFQRILQVMEEVEKVIKEDKKVNGQYKFVSHDAVTKALHGPCVKAGLVIMPDVISESHDGNRFKCIVETVFINADKPEEVHKIKTVGYGIDPQDKGPGKALSYAFKMALLKAFMLESGEEDIELSHIEFNTKQEVEPKKSGFRRTGVDNVSKESQDDKTKSIKKEGKSGELDF